MYIASTSHSILYYTLKFKKKEDKNKALTPTWDAGEELRL